MFSKETSIDFRSTLVTVIFLIDDKRFRQYKHYFISDTIGHHPFLEKHFQIDLIEKEQAKTEIDRYFKLLLGKHHAVLPAFDNSP